MRVTPGTTTTKRRPSWCRQVNNYPHSLPCGPTRYKTLPAGRTISRTKTHPHCTERSFLPRSPLPHRAAHSGRQCCLTEPRSERKTTPARGSGTPDETFSAPARHGSGHHEIFIAHTHPKCPISDHFHRAGAIFLSQRHPTQPHGATQGRYFFHATPGSTPAWRTPEKPSAPQDAEPERGAGGRRRGQSKHTRPKPRPIGGRRGACEAWPGFETTRRAKLAARTASGRAGHAAAGDQAG